MRSCSEVQVTHHRLLCPGDIRGAKAKSDAMMGDRDYDTEPLREGLRQMESETLLAAKDTEDGSGLVEDLKRRLADLESRARLKLKVGKSANRIAFPKPVANEFAGGIADQQERRCWQYPEQAGGAPHPAQITGHSP